MSYETVNIIVLVVNMFFILINAISIGYVLAKAHSIPKEREVVKQIMDAKIPIAVNPNMMPPGMQNPETPQEPLPSPGKKGNYFG